MAGLGTRLGEPHLPLDTLPLLCVQKVPDFPATILLWSALPSEGGRALHLVITTIHVRRYCPGLGALYMYPVPFRSPCPQ